MPETRSELVSVIIPCYNQAKYLADSLDSVLKQTYTNWECIIVNDGSTDGSEKVIQSYLNRDNRFIYIEQANGGLSNARNNGIKASTGEYIQLLDADDLLEPNKLEQNLSACKTVKYPETTITYSSMRYFEDSAPSRLKAAGREGFVAHIELKEADSLETQQELLLQKNPFVVSAPLFPSVVFKHLNVFDENLSALEDWDFNIRCSLGGYRFHHFYAENASTHIRLHNDSMMRNKKLLDENYYKLQMRYGIGLSATSAPKKPSLLKTAVINIVPPVIIRVFKKLLNRTTS